MPRSATPLSSSGVRAPAQTSTKFAIALPVLHAQPIAGGVHERLRLVDLCEISAQIRGVGERRFDRDDRGDVDAVDRNRRANRIQNFGRADKAANPQSRQAERLRERASNDDVRKCRQFGMNVVPANSQ
jgi:hypothetical protein